MPDLRGQIVYVMRVPNIMLVSAATTFGRGRQFTQRQHAER
jgi:hypothetical protein